MLFPQLLKSRLSRLATSFVVTFSLLSASPAHAQRVNVVRDAEIEALVADYVRPILKVAGLNRSGIEVVLVNDNSFNAFVAGRRIFVHAGALLQSESPNEIIGVLAHEVAHLAGGHQHRLREQLARAQTMAVVAMLVGVGAGVAGAATGSEGFGRAATGLAMGGTEMARRSLLGYQRTEEITADRAAVDYLNQTKQSGRGMLKTFDRMGRDLALAGVRIDPYQVSHPMPRDRIANLEELVRKSPYFETKDPAGLQLRHDLMRGKLAAYTAGPAAARRIFKDPSSIGMQYADAISTYLSGNPRDALAKIDRLIASQPKNPYLHEMRGEILIKANRPQDAAKAFGQAVKLAPSSGLLQVGYGQALLATGDEAQIRKAVSELSAGLTREREYVNGYRFLAQAHGRLGNIGAAELASAEERYYSGNYQEARVFAARAQTKLKRGSPEWVRAQDIINSKPQGR